MRVFTLLFLCSLTAAAGQVSYKADINTEAFDGRTFGNYRLEMKIIHGDLADMILERNHEARYVRDDGEVYHLCETKVSVPLGTLEYRFTRQGEFQDLLSGR